ncbi:uncharacterized protein A1O9_06982 [Exophiala aquamarina CBS 119918]|uniref:Phytanoyl-CoA dioxygenase n=1 Tax=Exophiala aquamarina CBS 119918 TaxID=1182545 RepID=A0A072PAN4_9EURO|nr:uncharacterized protein A1O9_06982 [Exophiala aquamarina CBS 119918]KEF56792.1 hypothetical protein A1O9_06982 [Exophiala aquamarina CBS 119918]
MATRKSQALNCSAGVDAVMSILNEDVCVVLRKVLSAEQVTTMNAEIGGPMSKIAPGSLQSDPNVQDFHGIHTKRLTNLVTHSKVFRGYLLDHDLLHGVCERVFRRDSGDYWMNTAQVIDIGPGNKTQPLHRDLMQFPIFARPGPDAPEATTNFFVALTQFTEVNRGTRCIPGIHRDPDMWDTRTPEETVAAEMDAGDIFLFSGKLVHGGGANRTENFVRRGIVVSVQYCCLTPEEAYHLIVEKELVKTMPKRTQKMIAFRSVFLAVRNRQ